MTCLSLLVFQAAPLLCVTAIFSPRLSGASPLSALLFVHPAGKQLRWAILPAEGRGLYCEYEKTRLSQLPACLGCQDADCRSLPNRSVCSPWINRRNGPSEHIACEVLMFTHPTREWLQSRCWPGGRTRVKTGNCNAHPSPPTSESGWDLCPFILPGERWRKNHCYFKCC